MRLIMQGLSLSQGRVSSTVQLELPSDVYDRDEAEYYADEKGKGLYKERDHIVKVTERGDIQQRTLSLLVNLFTTNRKIAREYISPLLAQYIVKSNVVQFFANEGNDLTTPGLLKSVPYATIESSIRGIQQFLMNNRLVHRDIKPENIVWTGSTAKLIDVDNMIQLPEGVTDIKSTDYQGTPGFVPPGSRSPDGRELTWSLNSDAYAIDQTLAQLKRVTGSSRRNTRKRRRQRRATRRR